MSSTGLQSGSLNGLNSALWPSPLQEKGIDLVPRRTSGRNSMTSMPLARVYSPVWEQMTLYFAARIRPWHR